ncbi:DUF4937 domain-containing protein [Candidatus Poribacteria bacterium]|nr:DUF4937 domain-containing protein [Candidatus Poribacteria bacterium]
MTPVPTLAKWITCRVSAETRQAFSRGQVAWRALADCPGFAGQTGGWNATDPLEARIVALWRGREDYDRFMAERHDPIFDRSGQRGTCERIETRLVTSIRPIGPPAAEPLQRAGVIYFSECRLRPGRDDHFNEVQRSLWNPGMAAAEGFLGGLTGWLDEAGAVRLVLTFWRTIPDHDAWRSTRFPNSSPRAGVENDVEELRGGVVRVEEPWRVPPGLS